MGRLWIAVVVLGGCWTKADSDVEEETGCTTCTSPADPSVSCSELSLDECELQFGCQLLSGREVIRSDTAADCYQLGEFVPFLCKRSDGDCPTTTTFWEGSDGVCYMFDGCSIGGTSCSGGQPCP